MYFNLIRVLFGFILILFLPGFTLIQLMFPRKGELDEEYDMLYRIVLGVGMSIVVVILVGFIMAHPDVAVFQEPYISIVFLSISAIFFIAGWYKGAYPWLGKIHPSLYRIAHKLQPDTDDLLTGKEITPTLVELRNLARDRQELRKKIKEAEKKTRLSAPSLKKYWENRRDILLQDLRDVEKKVADLQKERTDEIQGGLNT